MVCRNGHGYNEMSQGALMETRNVISMEMIDRELVEGLSWCCKLITRNGVNHDFGSSEAVPSEP